MKRNITYTLYLALFWLKLRYSAIEYDTVVVFVRVSVYAYVYMLAAEYNLTKVNSMLLYIHLVTSAAILSLLLSSSSSLSWAMCVLHSALWKNCDSNNNNYSICVTLLNVR